MQVQSRHPVITKPHLLLVGSGEVVSILSRRLSETWRLSILETGETENRDYPDGVMVHYGQPTDSVVLRQAGVDTAKAVLVATPDDHTNLEVCRLCERLFQVQKRFAFLSDRERKAEYEAAGIGIVSRNRSLAFAAESLLQPGTATASGVGLGRGEIYQVEVLPGSTAIGKTPRMLNPQSWLIAAIYRGAELIVPHGETEILAGDRVLLVGQPEILSRVANFFRAGTSEFPLQYGARIVALARRDLPLYTEAELNYLTTESEATGSAMLLGQRNQEGVLLQHDIEVVVNPEAFGNPRKLARALDEMDSGCSVLPAPVPRWHHSLGLGATSFFRILEAHNEPVLVSRGTYPYQQVVLGVKPGKAARFAAEMAVDLCRGLGAQLRAVAVLPSPIVSGLGYREELEEALGQVKRLGEIYGLKVETTLESGNPVHVLARYSKENDLLVLAHHVRRRYSWSDPDTSRHLLLRSSCSVLCLPHDMQAAKM